MAADFNEPTIYTNYADVFDQIKDNLSSIATMSGDGDNLPEGYVHLSADIFKTWDGTDFNTVVLGIEGGGTGRSDGSVARADSASEADEVSWSGVSGKPATATRWPAFSEVTDKPTSYPSAWSEVSGKPSVIAAGATQQEARGSIGVADGVLYDQASVSSNTTISVGSPPHTRQANASNSCQLAANYSQINSCNTGDTFATYSQINASFEGYTGGQYSQVNTSQVSSANAVNSQINSSSRVSLSTTYSSAWGYSTSGGASAGNQQIRLESITGIGRFKGNTTTTGFDYAEFFPNLTSGIIPVGTIVTLDRDKIKPAGSDDFILGVVSETYGVLGNSADFCWHGRELRNEFGGVIKQDVEMVRFDGYEGQVSNAKDIPPDATYYTVNVPVENPNYVDQGSDYKPRSERKDEWSIIGLMGQVYARVYEDIGNNQYVGADGKQSSTTTNLYCMIMTTPYDAEKGYGVAKCLIR